MELSVIIVSYNVRHFLEQCLLSVRKATENIDCEVFVVDNNSADGSCSMVRSEFSEVNLIMNRENRGFSAANNQALKLAAGRFILILNPDTIIEEDTLYKCISFMENHLDAGALGVRMINGEGWFLPESKRGVPTPKTAFFKMIGLSYLFPKSERFNRYYLGHLDNRKTTKADIISGAFMFLRREAVLKAGLLDEDFFMHGEDIDYSFRILQAGFSNYYFPETNIIHYKGESTKKNDLNVFITFYKGMIIFVRKHFNNSNLKNYIIPIQIAIIISAALSLIKRFLKMSFLPLSEGVLIYLVYRVVASFWGTFKFGAGYIFPETFREIIIPGYAAIILLSIAFMSGYRIPSKTYDAIMGVTTGIILILVVYALLPLSLRYSRTIIIIGGLMLFIVLPLWRLIVSFIFPGIADKPFANAKRTVIVADSEGYTNLMHLIASTSIKNKVAGRVSLDWDDMKEEVLGNIEQLREVIRVNRIKEVIFTSGKMTASQIIDSMHLISDFNIIIRIASAGEKYIFGSRYMKPEDDFIALSRPVFRKKIKHWLQNLYK